MSSALISSADASRIAIPAEDEDVAALRESVIHKLTYAVGRDPIVATDWDWFMASALAVRDHVLERWLASTRTNYLSQGKRVYYLSLEFLIGRLLHDSLNNLGLVDRMRAALSELGVDYDRLRNVEHHFIEERLFLAFPAQKNVPVAHDHIAIRTVKFSEVHPG